MQSERVSGNRASLVRHVSGATGLEPNPSVTFHLRVISKTVSYKSSLYGSIRTFEIRTDFTDFKASVFGYGDTPVDNSVLR